MQNFDVDDNFITNYIKKSLILYMTINLSCMQRPLKVCKTYTISGSKKYNLNHIIKRLNFGSCVKQQCDVDTRVYVTAGHSAMAL